MEKILYDFFFDFWRLVKKYASLPGTGTEWDNLIDEANALNKKHNKGNAEGRLYNKCIIAWLEYLNEREKQGKEVLNVNHTKGEKGTETKKRSGTAHATNENSPTTSPIP